MWGEVPNIHKKTFELSNPRTRTTLNNWCNLVREYKDPCLSITWIAHDPEFIPNVMDRKFKQQSSISLIIYDNLFDSRGNFKHFQDLKNIYYRK